MKRSERTILEGQKIKDCRGKSTEAKDCLVPQVNSFFQIQQPCLNVPQREGGTGGEGRGEREGGTGREGGGRDGLKRKEATDGARAQHSDMTEGVGKAAAACALPLTAETGKASNKDKERQRVRERREGRRSRSPST